MIYNADDLKNWDVQAEVEKGKWALARPVGLGVWDRITTAWEVLRGRCDGLRWHGQ